MKRAYHCSPRENRESIMRDGLRAGPDGLLWLWATREQAELYAITADDVWEVDVEWLPVVPSGRHHGELVCASSSIGARRLQLL